METVRFIIKARKESGEVFTCFRWTRDAASGIAHAKVDARTFGVECVEFWAEPV